MYMQHFSYCQLRLMYNIVHIHVYAYEDYTKAPLFKLFSD